MSEYQYYEFQAIDRPLSKKEQAAVESLSSRAEVTSTRAVFTYNYGDFRGDQKKVLQKYFDAMLYLANWGSKQLIFRLPRALVDAKALAAYRYEDLISTTVTKNHIILDIGFDDEDAGGWVEGEGWLSSLAMLRRDILLGDYRALYLAWLKAISLEEGREEHEDLLEPPVPAGLKKLSAPLKSLVDFFEKELERQKADKARIKRLNAMAQEEPEIWKQVFDLIKTKQTKAYDEAVKHLTGLRELAQHLGRLEEYESRLSQIQQAFSSLSGLKSRLRRAGLVKRQ